MILLNYIEKANMIHMEVMKVLFTQEPLMADLSFIYNAIRCICLIPVYYTLKYNQLSKKEKSFTWIMKLNAKLQLEFFVT